MSESFRLGGDTPTSDAILEKTADIPTLISFEAAQKLFESVKIRQDEINLNLTEQDMIKKHKIWREETSCSPLGRYLGHYKSLSADYAEGDLKREDTEEWRMKILRIHFAMLTLALDNNHVLQR